jgi:hypothetical protein
VKFRLGVLRTCRQLLPFPGPRRRYRYFRHWSDLGRLRTDTSKQLFLLRPGNQDIEVCISQNATNTDATATTNEDQKSCCITRQRYAYGMRSCSASPDAILTQISCVPYGGDEAQSGALASRSRSLRSLLSPLSVFSVSRFHLKAAPQRHASTSDSAGLPLVHGIAAFFSRRHVGPGTERSLTVVSQHYLACFISESWVERDALIAPNFHTKATDVTGTTHRRFPDTTQSDECRATLLQPAASPFGCWPSIVLS